MPGNSFFILSSFSERFGEAEIRTNLENYRKRTDTRARAKFDRKEKGNYSAAAAEEEDLATE